MLLLGSNMGDRSAYLASALQRLEVTCGRIVQKSALYESAAWGDVAQGDYLNSAVVLETTLSPERLLHCCQQIEKAHDRERTGKWHPRTLDIDIIFYNNRVVDLPELKIPHPLLAKRRFVLMPLAEILPNYIHPKLHQSVADLLTICEDSGNVWLWKA